MPNDGSRVISAPGNVQVKIISAAEKAGQSAATAPAPGVVHVPGPATPPAEPAPPAPPVAPAARLTGADAIRVAGATGAGIQSAEGEITPAAAAEKLAAGAAPDSLWLEVITAPAMVQPPAPAPAPDAPPTPDQVHAAEDTGAMLSYARHAGVPLTIEVRGIATVIAPVPVKIDHGRDPDTGLDLVTITPADDE